MAEQIHVIRLGGMARQVCQLQISIVLYKVYGNQLERSIYSICASCRNISARLYYLFVSIFSVSFCKKGSRRNRLSDVLVIVLIVDATENAMTNEYKSITEGIFLVLTIVGWDYFLDWLGYRFPVLETIPHASPILLIKKR